MVHTTHTHTQKNIQWKCSQKPVRRKRCKSLLYVQFHIGLQQSRNTAGAFTQPVRGREKKSPLVASRLSSWLQQALLSLHWCTLAGAQLRVKRSVSGPAIPSANQGLHKRAGAAGGWGKVQQWNTANNLCSPADGRLIGQLCRVSWNMRLCIRWSLEEWIQKRNVGTYGGLWADSMGDTEEYEKVPG